MKKNYLIKSKPITSNIFKSLRIIIALVALNGYLSLDAQQTYTFTNCGAAGLNGPTQLQVNGAYGTTNLNGLVTVTTQGIQQFTVPITMGYRIQADGAQGGVSWGLGARMIGEFTLTAGTVLNIAVGQQGSSSNSSHGSGGGASFVAINGATVPLIVAGGGGGRGANSSAVMAYNHGTTATAGQTPPGGGPGGTGGGGGAAANGATGGTSVTPGGGSTSSTWASGGGGFYTAGGTYSNNILNGGRPFLNTAGPLGGDPAVAGGNAAGGFGGGGGCGDRGAGGGGFSGGAGATNNAEGGGGGGSFNSGVNQVNTSGINSGNGRVIITELCFISLTASGAYPNAPSICSGNSTTLTTNAVSNYTWSDGSSASTSIVVSPTATTVYSVIGTSTNNCIAANVITVTVSGAQPTLSINTSTNQTCLGKTATLTASGAVTYTWTNGVTNGVSFFPQSTNTYTVVGQNGCGTVSAVSTITISPLPLTVITSNSVVCTNKTATLSATASATSYTWQPGNIIGASPNLIINPQANTNYTITATDGTCVGVANVSVNANPVPTLQIASSATTACPGDVVTFTASGGSNYTWTPGNLNGTSVSQTVASTALYSVQGDNQFGCTSNTSQVVSVVLAPNINVSTASPSICAGNSSTLIVTGANTYTWTGGSNGNSFIVNPSQTTVYSVDGANNNNPCIATRTLEVTVFTPSLSITGNTVICNGVTTNLTAGSASTYTWTHDASFPNALTTVGPNTNTTYTVNANHEFNGGLVKCPISGTIEVIVNPTPTLSVVATRSAMCSKETNTLLANGASSYSWVTTNTTIAASQITINPTSPTILSYTVNGASAQGCEGNLVYLFNVSACSGLGQIEGDVSNLVVYPNPSQGNITITAIVNMELKLINQLGQIVESLSLNEKNNFTSTLNNLSNGVYFIQGDNFNRKIVVAK